MNIKTAALLCAGIVVSICSFSQTLSVTGDVKDMEASYVYVWKYGKQKIEKDSFKVEEGRFAGTINVDATPSKQRFILGRLGILLWTEPGKMHFSGSAKDFKSIKVEGGPTLSDEQLLTSRIDSAWSVAEAKFSKSAAKDSAQAVRHSVNEMDNARNVIVREFINTHPNSYVSLDLIEDLDEDYTNLKRLFNGLAASVRQSAQGKAYAEMLEKNKAALERKGIGQPVLNFTRPDVNGNPVSIASFKGKYVLIDFWASWCKPCRAENPNVLAAYKKYKDANFTVVGVSIDDDVDRWKKAIIEDGMPWTQLRDRKNKKSEILDYYGITGIPSTLLIGPDGKIIARNLRGEALHDKLDQVMSF